MNCRDRSIALLLGHKDDMLVNYFKFFIGAKRGYDLKGCGLEESDNWMEEIFHSKVLEKLGYKLRITDIDNQKNIHSAVSQVIDDERPVCVWFDEYYLFYTPFYLNSHTGHIAVVNGYNKEKSCTRFLITTIYDHSILPEKLSMAAFTVLLRLSRIFTPIRVRSKALLSHWTKFPMKINWRQVNCMSNLWIRLNSSY